MNLGTRASISRGARCRAFRPPVPGGGRLPLFGVCEHHRGGTHGLGVTANLCSGGRPSTNAISFPATRTSPKKPLAEAVPQGLESAFQATAHELLPFLAFQFLLACLHVAR